MFLQEIKEIGVADLDKVDQTNFSKKYAYRKIIIESLRQRFRIEYLGALKQVMSKKKALYNVKVNNIVLVENENKKRVN